MEEFKEGRSEREYEGQVYLVRHAKSLYNEKKRVLEEKGGSEEVIRNTAIDLTMKDCGLSEAGLEEIKSLKKEVNALDIGIVLISPMRRSFETAYNLLKSHPNLSKIVFKVTPEIRGGMRATSGLVTDISKIIDDYKEKLPKLDISRIANEDEKPLNLLQKFIPQYKVFKDENITEKTDEEIIKMVQEVILKIYPKTLETKEEICNRVNKAKSIVKGHLKTLSSQNIESPQKLLIISHSAFIKGYLDITKTGTKRSVPNSKVLKDITDYSTIE
ncbi:unnamed protein product [Moneuplotes crassus]|uniref:Phosphoglycerate mutase n=1 Tax=Euplotes crassus TaxID=5936 RepID=A0AAD1UGR5_EUPCR|nr:unnamed protein product [Moneuplotes crassus]